MSVNQLIAELRTQLTLMKSDHERQSAIQNLLDGFCCRCGAKGVLWCAELGDFQDCCSVSNAVIEVKS